MNEKTLERNCCRIAGLHGWMSLKMISPNRIGIPDRVFIGYNSRIEWVEFKTPKGRLTPAQKRTIDDFRIHGQPVTVISDEDQFKLFMGFK